MNIAAFADFFFSIFFTIFNSEKAVKASLGFYFENKMRRRCLMLYDEVERLSQVNCHGVSMHAAL